MNIKEENYKALKDKIYYELRKQPGIIIDELGDRLLITDYFAKEFTSLAPCVKEYTLVYRSDHIMVFSGLIYVKYNEPYPWAERFLFGYSFYTESFHYNYF